MVTIPLLSKKSEPVKKYVVQEKFSLTNPDTCDKNILLNQNFIYILVVITVILFAIHVKYGSFLHFINVMNDSKK